MGALAGLQPFEGAVLSSRPLPGRRWSEGLRLAPVDVLDGRLARLLEPRPGGQA